MRENFWELPLDDLDAEEWEALCDRCGKCCLIKLEDEDTAEILFTRLACKLFDGQNCVCGDYTNRKSRVEDCLTLDMKSIPESRDWLPKSCAYLRRFDGDSLPDWHPLLQGGDHEMHKNGHSVRGITQSEELIKDNWEEAIPFIDRELGP